MGHIVALYRAGKVAQLVRQEPGIKYKWDCERAVIVTGRPDVKVGDTWPMCTMDEAIASGRLERCPTEADPNAVRVPVSPPVPKGDKP
jgi:hypothetical protein